MKARDMQVGVRYIVTHPSEDLEFQPGDKIMLCADGSIENVQAEGWMEAQDVPEATRGMQCEIDTAYIERKRARLLAELAQL
jgi:2-keto-4-pentenoate hydratase/2-oxohepta-3-ene-1,7-dioic acid hydratase in catechol pathway